MVRGKIETSFRMANGAPLPKLHLNAIMRAALDETHGKNYNWYDLFLNPELDDRRVAEVGINAALAEQEHRRQLGMSPRRPSSGRSNTMTRKERKEHYRRKGILEAEKEAARRAEWERLRPRRPEANWREREEARKRRKSSERRSRKARKAAAAPAGGAGGGSNGSRRTQRRSHH